MTQSGAIRSGSRSGSCSRKALLNRCMISVVSKTGIERSFPGLIGKLLRWLSSAFALVTADLCARACLLGGDQLEIQRLAILRENGLAAAEQDRLDREQQLIDEVSREKRAHH